MNPAVITASVTVEGAAGEDDIVVEGEGLLGGEPIAGVSCAGAFWNEIFVSPTSTGVSLYAINPTIVGPDSIVLSGSFAVGDPSSVLPTVTGTLDNFAIAVSKVIPVSSSRCVIAAQVHRIWVDVSDDLVVTSHQFCEVIWLIDPTGALISGPSVTSDASTRDSLHIAEGHDVVDEVVNTGHDVSTLALASGGNIRFIGATEGDDAIYDAATLTFQSGGDSGAGTMMGVWRPDQVWYYNGAHVQKAVPSGVRSSSTPFVGDLDTDDLPLPVTLSLLGDDQIVWMARDVGEWTLFESATVSWPVFPDDAPSSSTMGITDFAMVDFDGVLGMTRWTVTTAGSGSSFSGVSEASGWAFIPGTGITKTDDWVLLVSSGATVTG